MLKPHLLMLRFKPCDRCRKFSEHVNNAVCKGGEPDVMCENVCKCLLVSVLRYCLSLKICWDAALQEV